MAIVKVYPHNNPENFTEFTRYEDIVRVLTEIGVTYEIWEPEAKLPHEADSADVLKAFSKSIDKLSKDRGFKSADVMALTEHHPQRVALRQKFLKEHIHTDDEARYFVDGQGLFYIHNNDRVFAILCQKGDLINVPAGTKHWFDMGEYPFFKCIRVFTNEDGWVAKFTGSEIAADFPELETKKV